LRSPATDPIAVHPLVLNYESVDEWQGRGVHFFSRGFLTLDRRSPPFTRWQMSTAAAE
jgi:hypothetical protein